MNAAPSEHIRNFKAALKKIRSTPPAISPSKRQLSEVSPNVEASAKRRKVEQVLTFTNTVTLVEK